MLSDVKNQRNISFLVAVLLLIATIVLAITTGVKTSQIAKYNEPELLAIADNETILYETMAGSVNLIEYEFYYYSVVELYGNYNIVLYDYFKGWLSAIYTSGYWVVDKQ